MNRNIVPFTLNLLSYKWGIVQAIIAIFGLGGSIVGHVGTNTWNIKHTAVLVVVSLLVVIISKSISFAYYCYNRSDPIMRVSRFVQGDGLYKESNILVLEFSESVSVGQLITLYCNSSGADQPILIAEIIAVNSNEVLAVSITKENAASINKYFSEESRRKSLFATCRVMARNIAGESNG